MIKNACQASSSLTELRKNAHLQCKGNLMFNIKICYETREP